MGIGVSMFLLAVGAVFTWAVPAVVSGVDANVVGLVLMIAGVIGLFFTFLFPNLTVEEPAGPSLTRERSVR